MCLSLIITTLLWSIVKLENKKIEGYSVDFLDIGYYIG